MCEWGGGRYNYVKIAFITNSVFTFGGEQRVVCIIANELAKKYDVTVFTTDKADNKENPYNLDSKIQIKYFIPFNANIFVKGFRFLLRFPVIKQLKNLCFVQKIIYYNKRTALKLNDKLKNNYNIVIGVSGELTMLLGLAKKYGLCSKTIGWEHNSFEAYFRTKNMRYYKLDKLWIETTKNIDKLVLLNEDYVEKYKLAFNQDCDFIYNPRSFVSGEKSDLTDKSFITCCRFVPAKGIDLLLKSFLIFSRKNKEWKLKLVGDGPEKHEYEKFVCHNNLTDRVIFLGKRFDIKELLLQSSVYTLSSRWEGFPMCLTEAYEIGLPAVFYDIPAVIPFCKNDEGIICNQFDVSAYADAMEKLADDFNLRKKMGRNAIKMAESISVEKIRAQWYNLIDNI